MGRRKVLVAANGVRVRVRVRGTWASSRAVFMGYAICFLGSLDFGGT